MGGLTGAEVTFRISVYVAIAAAYVLFYLQWPKHNLLLWNAFRTTIAAVLFLASAAMTYSETHGDISWQVTGGVGLALIAAVLWAAGLSSDKSGANRTPWDN